MTSANDCDGIADLLPEFLAGRLSEDDDRRVREHLETCADCRNRANAVSLLQQTPVPVPNPERWGEFVTGVVEATEKKASRRILWVLAAVAAAAIIVFSWARLLQVDEPGPPGIDAVAREVAELPAADAAAWITGLNPDAFMPAGFDPSELSDEEIEQLVTEVGRT